MNHHVSLACFCPHWHLGLRSLATSGCVCAGCDQEEQGPLSVQLSLPQRSARLHSAYVGFHRSSLSRPLTNSRTVQLPVLSATNLVPNSLQRSLSGNFPEDLIYPRALASDVCRSDKGSYKPSYSSHSPPPYINLEFLLLRSNTQLFGGVCVRNTQLFGRSKSVALKSQLSRSFQDPCHLSQSWGVHNVVTRGRSAITGRS